jgi:hypothetical protein
MLCALPCMGVIRGMYFTVLSTQQDAHYEEQIFVTFCVMNSVMYESKNV